jgi:hypothetical protein
MDGSDDKEALGWIMYFDKAINKGTGIKSSPKEELDSSMKKKMQKH